MYARVLIELRRSMTVILSVCLPFSYISFSSSTFLGAPYRIFRPFLPWFSCHFYFMVIEQQYWVKKFVEQTSLEFPNLNHEFLRKTQIWKLNARTWNINLVDETWSIFCLLPKELNWRIIFIFHTYVMKSSILVVGVGILAEARSEEVARMPEKKKRLWKRKVKGRKKCDLG